MFLRKKRVQCTKIQKASKAKRLLKTTVYQHQYFLAWDVPWFFIGLLKCTPVFSKKNDVSFTDPFKNSHCAQPNRMMMLPSFSKRIFHPYKWICVRPDIGGHKPTGPLYTHHDSVPQERFWYTISSLEGNIWSNLNTNDWIL